MGHVLLSIAHTYARVEFHKTDFNINEALQMATAHHLTLSGMTFKHKEALNTLVKSLVQMTCSYFTIFFLNWPSLLYKTCFSAE